MIVPRRSQWCGSSFLAWLHSTTSPRVSLAHQAGSRRTSSGLRYPGCRRQSSNRQTHPEAFEPRRRRQRPFAPLWLTGARLRTATDHGPRRSTLKEPLREPKMQSHDQLYSSSWIAITVETEGSCICGLNYSQVEGIQCKCRASLPPANSRICQTFPFLKQGSKSCLSG